MNIAIAYAYPFQILADGLDVTPAVAVHHPLLERLQAESDDAYRDRCWTKHVAQSGGYVGRDGKTRLLDREGREAIVEPTVVDPATLPAKGRWRAAWRIQAGTVEVNLDAAKGIRVKELEAARADRLRQLDALVTAAEDDGKQAEGAAARAKRKAVRRLDLAAKVASLTSLEAVEAFTPDELAT